MTSRPTSSAGSSVRTLSRCAGPSPCSRLRAFGAPVGEVGSGIVNDPANRTQIEIDVAVLAPPEPGRPRRLLSLGEAKWGRVMTPQHAARLSRARDLLAASFDISDCALACYSAAGFSADLRSAAGPGLILISPSDLYGNSEPRIAGLNV